MKSDRDRFAFRPFFCPRKWWAGMWSGSEAWCWLAVGCFPPCFAARVAFLKRLNLQHLLLHPVPICQPPCQGTSVLTRGSRPPAAVPRRLTASQAPLLVASSAFPSELLAVLWLLTP